MKIPFSPPYINDAVIDEVSDALKSGWITTGPKVKRLEDMVCKYVGVPNALCINSATSGLILALKWYGIGQGDEVIIPDPMWTEIGENIKLARGIPVPVKLTSETDYEYTIEKIEEKMEVKSNKK